MYGKIMPIFYDTTYRKRLFDVQEFMIKEDYRSELTSILAELNEIKFVNGRKIFKLDMDLIKDVTSLLDYEHFAEGVFQRKHLVKHAKQGVRTFVYEIDLLNFLIDSIEKKLNE